MVGDPASGPTRASSFARRWLQPSAALLAAVISIALGFWTAPASDVPAASWAWSEALRPLDKAPIAPGTRVVFGPPPGITDQERYFWLYEASWRRPDLLWSLSQEWPLAEGPTVGVAVRLRNLPPGWHEVWRQGELCLAERGQAR